VKVEVAAFRRAEENRRVDSRWEGIDGVEGVLVEWHAAALTVLRDVLDFPVLREATPNEDDRRPAVPVNVLSFERDGFAES
jgi:hypothetical protein